MPEAVAWKLSTRTVIIYDSGFTVSYLEDTFDTRMVLKEVRIAFMKELATKSQVIAKLKELAKEAHIGLNMVFAYLNLEGEHNLCASWTSQER